MGLKRSGIIDKLQVLSILFYLFYIPYWIMVINNLRFVLRLIDFYWQFLNKIVNGRNFNRHENERILGL